MKTILVPTDFSEQANYALDLAAQMARKSGDTKIHILHIQEGLGQHSFNTMGQVDLGSGENEVLMIQILKRTRKEMDKLVESDLFEGLHVDGTVEVGNPFQGISKEIARTEAELVVMGTKGISGLDEVLIGSNTEKVVRYAKCPVITVKAAVKLDEIQNIVFATNMQEDQVRMVAELKKLQKLTGAKLHLVKVNTPNHFHTERHMRDEFARFVETHEFTNYTTNVYNDATEEDGILYFAQDIDANLIALGTHGRTGLLHLLSGSIAEDLVNHSQVPVWTISMKNKK
jgi:nucleotide-binding universal stress UspA family protein